MTELHSTLVNLNQDDIEKVIKSLEKHGMTALSETGDVSLDILREILKAAL